MNETRWERLSGIYHTARAQPPEKRRAFLDDACSGDPEMRAEIESLLQHDLPSLPAFSLIDAQPDTISEQPVAPGTQIGIYRIERALGAGGMGEVHLATDTRLNRSVALKFVSVAAEDARRRFRQETRAVSSLSHPHILTVHDSGQFAGREYLVTEFVDGGTLKTWLGATPRTWREKIELLIGVADALAAAHDAGILHRDVKPANILVAQNGYAKLADFGLAKIAITHDQETRSEPRTAAGVVVGTIDYMSPEQLSGGIVDQRSDVFSFGIVLYEALSGRRPFTGTTTIHVVEGILHGSPTPLAGDVPGPLRDIVAKTLEKDPADRYQSMRELVVDLRRAARHTGALPTVAPSHRRRSWFLAVALAALAVAVAFTVWRSAGAASPIKSIAVLPFRSLCGDDREYIADGLTESLIDALIDVPSLYVPSRTTMLQFKNPPLDITDLGRRLSVDAVMEGSVRCEGDRMAVSARLIDVANGRAFRTWNLQGNGVLEIQQGIADQVARSLRLSNADVDTVRRSPTTDDEAYQLYLRAEHLRQRPNMKAAEEAYLQAIERDHSFAEAYAGLAILYNEAGADGRLNVSEGYSKAKEAVAKALKIKPDLAAAISARGWTSMHFDWNWEAAERDLLEAIRLDPKDPETHHAYSHYLVARGRFDESLNQSQEAIRLDRANAGMLGHLVFHFSFARQYTKAVEAMDAAFVFDGNAHDAWDFGKNMYEFWGQLDKAIDARSHLPLDEQPRELIAAMQNGLAQDGPEGYWRALRDYEIARKENADGGSLAKAYAHLGERDKAIALITRAVGDHERWIPYMNVSPAFDNLRDDPEFQNLVKTIGLTPQHSAAR